MMRTVMRSFVCVVGATASLGAVAYASGPSLTEIESESHGRAWRPTNVPDGWHPLSDGAFAWRARGPGRWVYDVVHGWVWVPVTATRAAPGPATVGVAVDDLASVTTTDRFDASEPYCPIRARALADAADAARPPVVMAPRDERTFTPRSAPPTFGTRPDRPLLPTPRTGQEPTFVPTLVSIPRSMPAPRVDLPTMTRSTPRTVTSAFIVPRPAPPLRDTLAEARAARGGSDSSGSWGGSDDSDSSSSSGSSSVSRSSSGSMRSARSFSPSSSYTSKAAASGSGPVRHR